MDKNRNLQWIFVHFVICGHAVICQKLNETENLIWLRDCGNQFLAQPSQNEIGVGFNCFNGTTEETGYATVPPHIFKNLIIRGKGTAFKVLRRLVFNICNTHEFHECYSPLLLEIEPPIHVNIPCLLDVQWLNKDNNKELLRAHDFDAYGLDGGVMKHHRVKVVDFESEYRTDRYIRTKPFYNTSNDRGGPLVMNLDGKATVVGLKASSTDVRDGHIRFNFMPKLGERICEYSGVCSVDNLVEALKKLPTTNAPPSTKAPEDGRLTQPTPNGAENNEAPRRPSPDADEPEVRRRPTYSEGVEREESEGAEDEEDTDILLDKDFNGGMRLIDFNYLIFVFVCLLYLV